VDLSALRCEHLLLLPPFRYPFLAPVVNAIMGEEESASRGNTSSEVENLETMILHTRFGDGISILPRIIAQERAAGCSLLDITDLDVSYQLCLCWKKDNQNPALRLFLDHYQASYPASALSS
jgi:DNA-binding transcriptional LysR family regulator